MLKTIKRVGGIVLTVWGAIRFVPDLLESAQATAKYGLWVYNHTTVFRGGGTFTTVTTLIIGIGLIFSETIQESVRDWHLFRNTKIKSVRKLMMEDAGELRDVRIMDMGSGEERRATAESAAIDHKDWQELASRFEKLDKWSRADWFRDTDGRETWNISGGQSSELGALCKLAGAMLLNSPKVSRCLTAEVLSESDDCGRWLHFLKDKKLMSDYVVGLSKVGEGQVPFYAGSVNKLAVASYNTCIECSAEEI